jgi:biopolymer transport protein ExbB
MQTNTATTMTRHIPNGPARAFLCVLLALGVLTSFNLYAEDAAPPEGAAAAEHGGGGESLIDRFIEGGWVMYPITVCSIALVWLTVDLWMRTGIKKAAPPAQVAQVQDLFRAGDYVGAYQFCKGSPSAFTNTTRVGLSFLGDGHDATEAALFSELNKVNAAIQTRINYLSVIGVCTPMIGLTGTVTGMMRAFSTLKTSGAGDPAKLSGAIGEVLIATASGLFIAVPAFMFFYFLRNRLQVSMSDLQDIVLALFRKMPYAHLKDAHVGEEEFYAAIPNWVAGDVQAATAA